MTSLVRVCCMSMIVVAMVSASVIAEDLVFASQNRVTVDSRSLSENYHSTAAIRHVAGPKYPLVTLEIPALLDRANTAPARALAALQDVIIREFRKKNLFADVVSRTDGVDGVLTVQGSVVSWEVSPDNSGVQASGGTLTVQYAVFQKAVHCPFNRAVVKGLISPTSGETFTIASDHALVQGAVDVLTAIIVE